MIIRKTIAFFCLCLMCYTSLAQTDNFTGTWQLDYRTSTVTRPIKVTLSIGTPDEGLLYPAQLKLQSDQFTGTYQLLLIKKNSRQLGIGRNKIPVGEPTFNIGNWTVMLNGVFNLGKDIKGMHFLENEKLFTRQYGVPMPSIKDFSEKDREAAIDINSFLADPETRLIKVNDDPWSADSSKEILHSGKLPAYYGIMDSVYTNRRDCTIEFPGNKKNANGVVSLTLNGNSVIDQANLGYNKPVDEMLLDTGLNVVIFSAEAYGKNPGSTGKLKLGLGEKTILMDFGSKDDVAATFIVIKIYYAPPKVDIDSSFTMNNGTYIQPIEAGNRPQDIDLTDSVGRRINSDPSKRTRENTLLRNAKLVGSTIVTSKQITFAIWDDAVEDGDSISLSLNGKWVIQGLAVKKRPQFISVIVDPGPNKITFIADNLGSIVPNTSILEIIDGKERKSFMIDTNLKQNNLIDIFYDNKP